nr:MAG TPA: hypothetical protein [Caudoviricetes sp.]
MSAFGCLQAGILNFFDDMSRFMGLKLENVEWMTRI